MLFVFNLVMITPFSGVTYVLIIFIPIKLICKTRRANSNTWFSMTFISNLIKIQINWWCFQYSFSNWVFFIIWTFCGKHGSCHYSLDWLDWSNKLLMTFLLLFWGRNYKQTKVHCLLLLCSCIMQRDLLF